MSTPIQIRNVPEEVSDKLKARAAAQGRSLNAYMLDLLDVRGHGLTPEEGAIAMRDFEDVEAKLELWPLLDVISEHAIQLSEAISSYVATHVALAKILSCALVTADARLGRAVDHLIDVVVV